MSRRASLVLVAAAALSLLAGCGKSEKEKYTDKMKSISKQFAAEQGRINTGDTPSSLPEAATRVRRLQDVVTRLARRLADLKPPAKVKDLHGRFTMLVRTFAGSLGPAIQAAEAGDLKRFSQAAAAVKASQSTFVGELATVNSDYRSRGYKLN